MRENENSRYKQREDEDRFEYGLRVIEIKCSENPQDLDWQDIVELLDLNIHKDSLRKACNTTEFSSYNVMQYFKNKALSKLPQNKMDELREAIGELDIKKHEVKSKTQQLNKIKRDFVKAIEIANDLKEDMYKNGVNITIPSYCNEEIEFYNDNKMIINISDWHIGYIIHNCKGNKFNLEIANKRVELLTREVEKYCKLYNINKVYVVNTGDIIEHTYMRGNQSQNTEFGQSRQINESIRLIEKFLISLNSFADVEYYSLAGNHDRTCGDKSFNEDGDNANVVISEQLYDRNEIANNKRLKIINGHYLDREIILEVNGVKCKFIHGDDKIKDGKSLLQTEMSMDEDFYQVLFRGHWHNFSITSENKGRYVVNTGCLSGFNDYSTRFGCASNANQTICIIGDNEVELIKGIDLQIN